MQVTVEDISTVKKKLHIEIPPDTVEREMDSAYQKLKKTAKIKGFRPGKVPKSVLEQMFKKDVQADVSSKLIQESFLSAVKENDLRVVGSPQVDPPEFKEAGQMVYDATVEVTPDIDNIDFSGLTLHKTDYQISDAEIDQQLSKLQQSMAQHVPIEENRPAQTGDVAIIDYEGLKDGKPFTETQRTENFSLKIGAGKVLDEFENGLVGMGAGEDKEIKVAFPEDYFNKKLAGLTIDFQVTLKEIRNEVLPELDDAFAKKAGDYENLDQLRETVRGNLAQGYAKRVEQELNEQIFKALIEKHAFEVPESMVTHELEGIVTDTERSFAYRNISMEDLGLTREGLEEKYRDTAVKQVKRHLILSKIIDQEQLDLEEAELEDGFKEMAESLGQSPEEVKGYYSANADKLEYFRHALLEKKALKLIIDQSETVSVAPENEPEQAES